MMEEKRIVLKLHAQYGRAIFDTPSKVAERHNASAQLRLELHHEQAEGVRPQSSLGYECAAKRKQWHAHLQSHELYACYPRAQYRLVNGRQL